MKHKPTSDDARMQAIALAIKITRAEVECDHALGIERGSTVVDRRPYDAMAYAGQIAPELFGQLVHIMGWTNGCTRDRLISEAIRHIGWPTRLAVTSGRGYIAGYVSTAESNEKAETHNMYHWKADFLTVLTVCRRIFAGELTDRNDALKALQLFEPFPSKVNHGR